MTLIRNDLPDSKANVYQEKDDLVFIKHKAFWSKSIEFYIRDFLKHGGEARWQNLGLRIDWANLDELLDYHRYVDRLVLKRNTNRFTMTSNELILLGYAYFCGEVVERSYYRAYQCFLDAKNRNPLALYLLGSLYYPKNKDERTKILKAQSYLEQLKNLLGLPSNNSDEDFQVNFEVAKYYFEQAKQQGIHCAALTLGDMYMHGIGVKKNPEKAFEEFVFADQGNDPRIYLWLAKFYLKEIGDDQRGFNYLEKSAASGNPLALAMMGTLLNPISSRKIQKDPVRASIYFQYTSKRDFGESSFLLANLYIRGIGIPVSLNMGVKLLRTVLENPHSKHYTNSKINYRNQACRSLLLVPAKSTFWARGVDNFDWANNDYRDWIALLYHVCAAFNIENPEKTALDCDPVKLDLGISFSDLQGYLQIIKSRLLLLVQNNPDFFADLISQETNPHAVIKSLSHWLGEAIKPILDNQKVKAILEQYELSDFNSLREIESSVDMHFNKNRVIAMTVMSYLKHGLFSSEHKNDSTSSVPSFNKSNR